MALVLKPFKANISNRAILVSSCLFSLAVFAAITYLRFQAPWFSGLDAWAGRGIAAFHSDGLIRILVLLTEVFNSTLMLLAALSAAALLLIGRRKRLALILLASLALGVAMFYGLKLIFAEARPTAALLDVPGFAYPSGHATIASIVFLFLSYLYAHIARNGRVAALFYALNLCMILAVGTSRVYLGVHWLSDVVAGIFLGAFCFTLVLLMSPRAN